MALDRKVEVLARHPRTVVADADEVASAAGEVDVDAPGAGVDGVFHQLLDHARGALDHLAGGDAIDGVGAQAADCHYMALR